MGDFKCKSGVSSDNSQKNNKNENFDAVNNPAEDSNYNNGINSRYNENKDYSKPTDDDCGCGGSINDSQSSDYSDNLQNPDEDNSAMIYSETIIFTDPYSGVDDQPATSDLVDDAQEGSEYISSDSNPSKPMC